MSKQQYALTIKPLTSIHIGTGEELTPLDYKIASKVGDMDFKKPMYWRFSSDRILKRLLDDQEQNEKNLAAFERVSVKGNMKELQKFFQEHCTHKSDTDYPCEVTKGFLKTYNANLDKDPYQNAAKVLPMYHTAGTPRPVIPGSSLKGSLRTALLNYLLADLPDRDYDFLSQDFERESRPERYEGKLQKKLLRYHDGKDDPFRGVLVSDCSFKAGGTQIVGGLKIVSFSQQTESLEPVGTQIQAEVLKGTLLGGNPSADLQICIDRDLQRIAFPIKSRGESDLVQKMTAISIEDLRSACNEFYLGEFQSEYDTFYRDVTDGTEGLVVQLKKQLEEAAQVKNQCILRVGRWSQVEFVTFVKPFRKPRTKKDKFGKQLGAGGTRTLFDYDGSYVPMGWCILTIQEA